MLMRLRELLCWSSLAICSLGRADSSLSATMPDWVAKLTELPVGCFAWSPRSRSVACVTGEWNTNVDGEHWQVVLLGAGADPIALSERQDKALLGYEANVWGLTTSHFSLAGETRQTLQRALAKGQYAPIAAKSVRLRKGQQVALPGGSALGWNSEDTSVLSCGSGKRTHIDELQLATFAPPEAASRVRDVQLTLPGASQAVLVARLGYGMEGQYGSKLIAVLVDLVGCVVRQSSPLQ
jgi:hypothetical protein